MNELFGIPSNSDGNWTVKLPPKPKWKMTLNKGAYMNFNMPTAPNAFHRWMQRLMLGIVWERIEED